LERKVLVKRELERRQVKKTPIGIVHADGHIIRTVKNFNGTYVPVDEEPLVFISEKLSPIITKPKRFKIMIGGRGGAKSRAATDAFIIKSREERAGVLCLREYQNSIADSVHAYIKDRIVALDVMPEKDVGDTKVDMPGGGYFRFKGMSRDTAAIKSAHGFKYSWVEEAQTMSEKSIDDLLPTIREADSECWFTANPQSSGDPFSQEFIVPYQRDLINHGYYEDDLYMIIVVNWSDNPWFADSPLARQRLDNKSKWSKVKYNHIWEGAFMDQVENSIIEDEWFDACIDAHIKLGFKPNGKKIMAHDASDTGDDPAADAIRHGSVITEVNVFDEKDVNDNGDISFGRAIKERVDVFNFDADGLGVALRKPAAEAFKGKHIKPEMFKGSWKPDDPDGEYDDFDNDFKDDTLLTNQNVFKNCRAQNYWQLRMRCYYTFRAVVHNERMIDEEKLISFSSEIKNIQSLKAQLCRIPKKANPNGMIQIMTKDEMWSKHKIKSPNEADAVMMTMRFIDEPDWSVQDYAPIDIV